MPPRAAPTAAPLKAAKMGPAATRGPMPGMARAPIRPSSPGRRPTGLPWTPRRRAFRGLGPVPHGEIQVALMVRQDGGNGVLVEAGVA